MTIRRKSSSLSTASATVVSDDPFDAEQVTMRGQVSIVVITDMIIDIISCATKAIVGIVLSTEYSFVVLIGCTVLMLSLLAIFPWSFGLFSE